MFDSDGTLLWDAFIQENSNGNGASAFDFDGDGALEVVYADAVNLHILDGRTGAIRFQTEVGNITTYEAAIPADVDGDGNVEVVAVASVGGAVGAVCGVFVYGDAADQWVQSRGVWNQHNYHITNVNDDGTIPATEVPSWTRFNSYRANRFTAVNGGTPVDGCAFAKPDLTASFLRIGGAGPERRLTVRIGNGGNAVAGAGTPVSFYDGPPLLGGSKLGTASLGANLAAGSFEDIELLVDANTTTEGSIWVVADDFGGLVGTLSESNEDNNAFDSGLSLVGASGVGLADLAVSEVDTASLEVDGATLELSGTLSATVRNQGELAVSDPFDLVFFEDANRNQTYEAGVDVLLGTAVVDGTTALDAGASVAVTAAASGTVLFAGNLVYAFADSGLVVTESNETNNVSRSGADCAAELPRGASDMVEEWSFTGSLVQPSFRNVTTTPVVADLTGDGVADVVFVTFSGTNTAFGYLRAVDGASRQELFTADAFDWRVYGLATPAIGDLDANGVPDIVAVDDSRRNVMAFEWDAVSSQLVFKWKSQTLDVITLGAVSIADLEGDGRAEVLYGRQVLESDGTLRWTGSSPRRGHSFSPLSVAVDLDGDGVLEVVTGDVAYTASGSVFWDLGIADGFVAVGNFDADPEPELVHVDPSSSRLRVLEHDGTVKWGLVDVPGIGVSSPPTVADVDGDGRPEIAVARRDLLTVFETGGFVRWSVPVTHTAFVRNSGAVAAAFDFDGDGAAELVYHDETGIRILSGRDGSVVDEELVPSCHRSVGYVSVADVDGDGAAELVAGLNDSCDASASAGLRILGESSGNWVRTRGLWNQHNYHVTNVEDDASVPAVQTPSWLQNNSFRHQTLRRGSIFTAPDMTVSFGRLTEDGTDLVITVRIGNGGAAVAPAGIPVSLYNGNPQLGFPLLGSLRTASTLEPGSFEDVSFRFPSDTLAEDTLVAVADDDGTSPLTPAGVVVECNEDNNAFDTGLTLNLEPVVDAGADVSLEFPNATTTLQGNVTDDGFPLGGSLTTAWQVAVGPLGSDVKPPVFSDQTSPVSSVSFQVAGTYVLRLVADDTARIGTDEVTIVVGEENLPPVVDAGPDADVELPSQVLTMAGSVTDDGLPAGVPLDTRWFQISGPGAVSYFDRTSPVTAITFPLPGTYILSLEGREELSASDTVVVTVHPENVGPVVSAGADQTIFSATTLLSGSARDPDGLPLAGTLTTRWSQVSGPAPVVFSDAGAVSTEASFGATGTYVLRLQADDGALVASDEVAVEVDVTNAPPLVEAGPDQTVVFPESSVTLSGSVADDGLPAGGSRSVVWNLLSGPAPAVFSDRSSLTTNVSFTVGGRYLFRLDASDTELVGQDTVTVVVEDGNTAPWVDAGADQSLVLPAAAVSLAGTATDDGLPAGSMLSYLWTTASGPAPAVFTSPEAPATQASFEQAGVYVLRLTVTDGALSASDEVQVVVEAAPAGSGSRQPTVTTRPETASARRMRTGTRPGSTTTSSAGKRNALCRTERSRRKPTIPQETLRRGPSSTARSSTTTTTSTTG